MRYTQTHAKVVFWPRRLERKFLAFTRALAPGKGRSFQVQKFALPPRRKPTFQSICVYTVFLLSFICFQPLLFSMAKSQKSISPCSPSEKPLCPPVLPGFFNKAYPLTEIKGGYFFFASASLRDVYSSGGFAVQLSSSYPVYECLQVYGSIGYLQAWGKSRGAHQSTTIWQIPVDIGLKPLFNITPFAQYYVAIGPRYFYVHQHNDSVFVDRNLGKSGIGFFVNTGFNFYPTRHVFIDLFAEYAYEPTSFSSSQPDVFGKSVQVSPVAFGIGIGYPF